MLKKLTLSLFVLLFAGCGYQPSINYTKKVFDTPVFVEVTIDRIEPENAPFLTDELRRIVVSRFGHKVSTKEEATNKIKAIYKNIEFIPLAYDINGYTTTYKTIATIDFALTDKNGKSYSKKITASTYDSASTSSLQSTTLKQLAIKRVLEQATDEFVSYVTVLGVSDK
jgi:outer membrane lipopolysaccharide assembly protein LptE/RlpB